MNSIPISFFPSAHLLASVEWDKRQPRGRMLTHCDRIWPATPWRDAHSCDRIWPAKLVWCSLHVIASGPHQFSQAASGRRPKMAINMAQYSRVWFKTASVRLPRGVKTASRRPKIAVQGSRSLPTASSRAWLKIASKRPQDSLRSFLDGLVGIHEVLRIIMPGRLQPETLI